jgi:hypothetical protein
MHITSSLAALSPRSPVSPFRLDPFQFAPTTSLSDVVSLADAWTRDDVEHDFDMVDLGAWSEAPE